MAYSCAVAGASGYAGMEVLRLAADHPDLDVVVATAESNVGVRVAELAPSLGAAYPDLSCDPLDSARLDGLDVVFLALPHGASQKIVPELLARVGHVVDLGADFRLGADAYERWYGEAHAAPDLIGRFAYGMPELFRKEIQASEHVAVPGCYPTAVSLALAPVLGAIEGPVVANAVSGVTGAGRSAKVANLFAEIDENVMAYGLLTHRHTGEMERNLEAVAEHPVDVLFTPHLVPMSRGILATCTARVAEGATTERLLEQMREFYSDEVFVRVTDDPPRTKATRGSNAVHVSVRADERTGTVLAFGALDNLVKGAAGQAIQCANLVLGVPEGTGLTALGVAP